MPTTPTASATPLDSFDSKRHGGEVMADAPVGREIGSPAYERLSILDMYTCGTITESRAMELLNVDRAALLAMLARDGLSVEIKKAALDNPELPLPFVRDIMVSREEVTSGQLTAYELDDGQSASTQGGVKS